MARGILFICFLLAAASLVLASLEVGLESTVRHDAVPVADNVKPAEAKVPVNRMQKPELSPAAFTGLVVGFIFLAIFLPGFMCLWNIQPPQTFEVVETADARKKMQ